MPCNNYVYLQSLSKFQRQLANDIVTRNKRYRLFRASRKFVLVLVIRLATTRKPESKQCASGHRGSRAGFRQHTWHGPCT